MKKTTCRLCESPVREAIAFNALPMVNSHAPELYPCGLSWCEACGHIQSTYVVGATLQYGDYRFRTGDYPWLVGHYKRFAAEIMAKFNPFSVVEIGSNDGTLLGFLPARITALGIDPCGLPSLVETLKACFDENMGRVLAESRGQADVILCNNAFAHIDDLSSVVRGIKRLLAPHGTFIFEAAYGLDMLEGNYFDTIYHEHLDFHTVSPLAAFFERTGLRLYRLDYNDSKGGTIRGFVCHQELSTEPDTSVLNHCVAEDSERPHYPHRFEDFERVLQSRRQTLHNAIGDAQIIGYGAGAGGIASMYHLGLEKRVSVILDDAKGLQGEVVSPENIPVMSPEYFYDSTGSIVVLAWRFAEQIKRRHPQLAGRIIVP